VVKMMRYFQRMSEALISCLDRDEARFLAPHELPPCNSVGTSNIHRELEQFKFLKFIGASDYVVTRAWLENMAM